MIYIDSSVLLEIYLFQPRRSEALRIVNESAPKVSSWLLAIEVPVVLRRMLASPKDKVLLHTALTRFDHDVLGISLFGDFPDLVQRIRNQPLFSRCRALDAVHLGSAAQLQEATGHKLRFSTFDRHLAKAAEAMAFEVLS